MSDVRSEPDDLGLLSADDMPPPPRRDPTSLASLSGGELAGYELGEEIGRGGMGVVVRARHRQLDRPVAVKLVLSGAYADRNERDRFLVEAKATARLTHPNIVQIYEVGEEHGVPFMALELVEGGSLAKAVADRPLPAARTAALVETLARAVAYAHSRGVVHRDLKPANVLMAGEVPKIVDFGVAKVLDGAATARSGVLAGTPSYMAPEQAAGDAVGPPADVYALGAVLYECLTGRPPFKAASVGETLDLVRSRPPVAPADLQPGLPRDLNTISLKCLEKEPRRRYASAAAVADDLHRFLAGEPIVARPVSRAEKAWRWVKRNPRVAALLAVLAAVISVGVGGVLSQWQRAEGLYHTAEGQRTRAEGLYAESERRGEDLRREKAAAEALVRERDRAIEDMAYLVGVIDQDQLFHLRMMPVRKELLEPALRENRAFLDENDGDVEREAEVVAAWFRVAILTRLTRPRAEALEVGKTALDRQRRFVDTNPEVAQYRRDLATCYHNVGFLLHATQRSDDALEFLAKARRIREALLDEQRENLDYRSELAGCLNDIGLAYSVLGQARNDPANSASAEQVLRTARDHQRQVVARAGHVLRYRVLLGNHIFNLARLVADLGRPMEIEALVEELRAVQPDGLDGDVRVARVLAVASRTPGPVADALAAKAVAALERALARDGDPDPFLLKYDEFVTLRDRPDYRRCAERVSGHSSPRRASAERQ